MFDLVAMAHSHEKVEIQPRLLNASQAARYLGFSSRNVLKGIPVEPIQLAEAGIGRARRWDRQSLDDYLDDCRNVTPRKTNSEISAVLALDEWVRLHGNG